MGRVWLGVPTWLCLGVLQGLTVEELMWVADACNEIEQQHGFTFDY